MAHILYNLFIACCMFTLAASGLAFAVAMWRRSENNCICKECRKELDK